MKYGAQLPATMADDEVAIRAVLTQMAADEGATVPPDAVLEVRVLEGPAWVWNEELGEPEMRLDLPPDRIAMATVEF